MINRLPKSLKNGIPALALVAVVGLGVATSGCTGATDNNPAPSKDEQIANLKQKLDRIDKGEATPENKEHAKKYVQDQIDALQKGGDAKAK